MSGDIGRLLESLSMNDPLEDDAVCKSGGLLLLSTSSLARFTRRRSGEWGGVTTVSGLGDGRGELAERLPNCISSTLPLIGVRSATYNSKDGRTTGVGIQSDALFLSFRRKGYI